MDTPIGFHAEPNNDTGRPSIDWRRRFLVDQRAAPAANNRLR